MTSSHVFQRLWSGLMKKRKKRSATVTENTIFKQNHDLPLTLTQVLLLPKPYHT